MRWTSDEVALEVGQGLERGQSMNDSKWTERAGVATGTNGVIGGSHCLAMWDKWHFSLMGR